MAPLLAELPVDSERDQQEPQKKNPRQNHEDDNAHVGIEYVTQKLGYVGKDQGDGRRGRQHHPNAADPVVAEVNDGTNQPPKFFHPSALLVLWILPVVISPACLCHDTSLLTFRMLPPICHQEPTVRRALTVATRYAELRPRCASQVEAPQRLKLPGHRRLMDRHARHPPTIYPS